MHDKHNICTLSLNIKINLHLLRNRLEKLTKGSLVYLFLKLIQNFLYFPTMYVYLCSNSLCSSEHKLCMYNIANDPSLNNFWFVDKTNKDKLVMKLSGAVTISIYYLSIIHHHIHIIIYNNENHIYCPSWKETLSLLLLYNYIVHIYKEKIQYWNIHNNCSHKHN